MILIDEDFKGNLKQKTYIALGSFDGIHKGHLTLMDELLQLSKKHKVLSMVYTFKNHPLTIIKSSAKPKIVMVNQQKIEVLDDLGVDLVCLDEFNRELMVKEPEDFIKMLLKKFNAKGFVVGFNYRFGYKNKGDIKLLKELSEKYDFELSIMEAYKEDGKVVSSSRIRELITTGEIEMANELLTRKFILTGEIVHGKKLGRTIGFPTANLAVDKNLALPKLGVYYTNVEIDGNIFKSITSVGNNPTVNGDTTTVETYILNFSKDIYGKNIKLYFIEQIREQHKFASIEELKKQLEKDKMFAYNRKI
ncbi:bifunctional riboflavin kinase/FAD synthetase [uncultured Clostridium sp.]|jgi:riboflavin kinase/FMN adenylyltransferase|uniref:bifunctional riboflavin kinase/FAD synthetase n=1 Tax=uncultured Clostridium sp. TaxID=59620 RepID=UPI00261B77A6|nr:bifunctional riboflavin kinase/FAD synthetase [uncultured Clostridium sp.]